MYQVIVLENGIQQPIGLWHTEIQALLDGMCIEAGYWQKLGIDTQTIVNQVSGSN